MTEGSPPELGEVTMLLRAVREGDSLAEERLFPLMYERLRALARRQLSREGGPPTLHPTELVHEAYFKLAGQLPALADRAHFLALAARAMRQVLVDRARSRRAQKRGSGHRDVTLGDRDGFGAVDSAELLSLNDALDTLDERQRRVVEMRYFGGLEEREIAEVLGVTTRTVQRDWAKARAWLYRELYDEDPGEAGGG